MQLTAMYVAATNKEAILALLAVFAICTWMIFVCWRIYKQLERDEKDPLGRRKRILRLCWFLAALDLFACIEVLLGKEPLVSLIGLPISIGLIWLLLSAAKKMERSPK
jgi:hypothetical protein